ncbi:MAG TPA: glycosyltransferase family 1 protein [Anseongella sp.]|nr:glycosyltransferase family 1 protein [Anseongella sp.]
MKRKIAFISEHASPLALVGGVDSGGQNIYVDRVARHLSKLGYEVDIYTRWDDPGMKRIVPYLPGVRVIHVAAGPKTFIPKEQLFGLMDEFTADMIATIKKYRLHYDLVHAHFWMSGYVAARLKELLTIPFVITFHALGKVRRMYQGSADGFPDTRFSIEEEIVSKADGIIAECPQDKEDLMILYYACEEKIRVVPCGFDPSEFYPMNKKACKRKIGVDPEEKIILQLGRMVPRKGVENVIRGLGMLTRISETKVRLLVVGGESYEPNPVETPEIGRLQQIAQEENVLGQVTFTGRRDRKQLKYYYNAADIFISTPWYEPFGITPLEAMACGVPVIGANVGGIKYSVAHNKTGFLVPAHEPEILCQRMLEIISKQDLARWLGVRGIVRVNSSFTWEIVTKAIAAFYEELAGKKGRQKVSLSKSEAISMVDEVIL